jgi:hypothetical protein
MATILTSMKRPVGAKLDPVPNLRSTALAPAPKLQPAPSLQSASKVITGTAVSQPAQPAAAQQPSPGQAAQAAPKPAPTWRAGNSVSNGYQQDRASELYQRGMSATQAARQAASDTQRVNAMWKNAPKVDEKSLSTWGKDASGKFKMLKAGSATPGGVTAPTTAPKAAAVKVTTPAARPAVAMPQVAPSPTKAAATVQSSPLAKRLGVAYGAAKNAATSLAGSAAKAAKGVARAGWRAMPSVVNSAKASMPVSREVTKRAASQPQVKAAVSVKPAVALPSKRGLQDRMTSNFMGPNAKQVPVRKSMHRPVAGKPLPPSQPAPASGFWRTLGNVFTGQDDPYRFTIPESDRQGYRVGK